MATGHKPFPFQNSNFTLLSLSFSSSSSWWSLSLLVPADGNPPDGDNPMTAPPRQQHREKNLYLLHLYSTILQIPWSSDKFFPRFPHLKAIWSHIFFNSLHFMILIKVLLKFLKFLIMGMKLKLGVYVSMTKDRQVAGGNSFFFFFFFFFFWVL